MFSVNLEIVYRVEGEEGFDEKPKVRVVMEGETLSENGKLMMVIDLLRSVEIEFVGVVRDGSGFVLEGDFPKPFDVTITVLCEMCGSFLDKNGACRCSTHQN